MPIRLRCRSAHTRRNEVRAIAEADQDLPDRQQAGQPGYLLCTGRRSWQLSGAGSTGQDSGSDSLFAKRKLDARESGKTLEKRIGKKIIDSRLTIKNYSSLDKYKNISLLGAYEIDAEGVVPAQEITLVENGILTHLLNGRYPTKYTTESTGSSRYTLSVGRISFTTAPGTLHISAKDGLKPEKMKKALIKAAREEGLDYAYIVRKFAGQASLVYKVDVKDGKETMVRAGNFSPINLPKLKRLLAISAKERISNYILNQEVLTSLICPSAILVEDIEINPSELRKSKEPVLLFPLKRE